MDQVDKFGHFDGVDIQHSNFLVKPLQAVRLPPEEICLKKRNI